MFDTLSRQFKELLKFPFIHKIRNGSKHYAGRYLDGKAYYYYDERADGRVYEGSFYYLGKYYYHPHGKTTDYVSGTYLHSSKHGRWKFHHKRHGSNKLLYVDYFEGRHNGIYKYKSSGKNGRNGVDNLLLVEMSDGHPCGAITVISPARSSPAAVMPKAVPTAHGPWIFRIHLSAAPTMKYGIMAISLTHTP